MALDSEVETPPPKKIGEGRTPYGAMCEPPIDLPTAWSARPFQDFESHMRETYVEGYAKILEQEKEQENEGRFVEPDVRMQPKVAQRGKSNKLFCNYVDDNPTGLEAPTDVRRGNLVWPDEWYINKTVLTKQGTDPDMHLSKADVRKLGNIFQAAENKKQEADLKAVATRSSRVRESLKAMGKNFMTGGVAFKRGKEKEKTQDDRDQVRVCSLEPCAFSLRVLVGVSAPTVTDGTPTGRNKRGASRANTKLRKARHNADKKKQARKPHHNAIVPRIYAEWDCVVGCGVGAR